MMRCNLCCSGDVSSLGTVGTRSVSLVSDIRPSQTVAEVFVCDGCGHLQKMRSSGERRRIERFVYGDYVSYRFSGGKEQMLFPTGKEPRARSYDALERVRDILPGKGKLLDVGTGDGAFLKSAARLLGGWDYFAFDLDESKKERIMGQVPIRDFYTSSFEGIDQDFDLIVLWHVLEHMGEPREELKRLSGLLTEDGAMFIQVPDAFRNPFDLAVVDHCSHFTHDLLCMFLKEWGFCVVRDGYDWTHNCLSFLLKRGSGDAEARMAHDSENAVSCFHWLNRTIRGIRDSVRDNSFSIFGTGMSSTWCYFQMEKKPLFFIDEDRSRTGSNLDGVKIVHPSDIDDLMVEKGHKVVMPFTGEMSERIAEKMKKGYAVFGGFDFVLC